MLRKLRNVDVQNQSVRLKDKAENITHLNNLNLKFVIRLIKEESIILLLYFKALYLLSKLTHFLYEMKLKLILKGLLS